ncbi:hypothetical protein M4951_04110 [Blastopirellula sp. J2-11]|uniref:ZIP family metal transporter n=1 Tax=Blastopirellula sp. J2-11 TaxID=2943192 RepID=UPI0021CA9B41|nr:hypothetical protein [Blastopirellula sp. J2-11]UUO07495.1 hypothetical protein M4951_04110 [Blastopirellula sp. J2-11]
MPDSLQSLGGVALFALIPLLAAISGAVIAAYRPPNSTVRSYIQHLAAGVVFSVVAVELLPQIVAKHEPFEVALGFSLGVAVMLGIRHLAKRFGEDKPSDAKGTTGLLAAVGVDIALDGLLIGITFSAGETAGRLLTCALAIELLSLGLAVAAALGKAGASRRRIITTTTLLFSLVVVGAAVGALSLQNASQEFLELVLSFGLAALLYLVTEELLIEAHEEPETPLATAMFFGGFLLFLILGMLE